MLGTGCASDRVTAPSAPSGFAAELAKAPPATGAVEKPAGGKEAVSVMQWEKKLKNDVSVTQTIGPDGGVIIIPQTGGAVVFSAGAVSVPTSITMTANAGAGVSYSFEPHGLQFNAPVFVAQDMGSVKGKFDLSLVGSIAGGYTPDGLADISGDTAQVSEIHPAGTVVQVANGKQQITLAEFSIQHFSGYILTGGRGRNNNNN